MRKTVGFGMGNAKLIKVIIAIVIFLKFSIGSLTVSANDLGGCAVINVEKKPRQGFTCKHPDPSLKPIEKLPVFFTVIDNQCDHSIRVMGVTKMNGRRFVWHSDARPKQQLEFIGCGKPNEEPLGWCLEREIQRGRCPEITLKKFSN